MFLEGNQLTQQLTIFFSAGMHTHTHTDAKLSIYTVETGLYALSSLHLKHTEV